MPREYRRVEARLGLHSKAIADHGPGFGIDERMISGERGPAPAVLVFQVGAIIPCCRVSKDLTRFSSSSGCASRNSEFSLFYLLAGRGSTSLVAERLRVTYCVWGLLTNAGLICVYYLFQRGGDVDELAGAFDQEDQGGAGLLVFQGVAQDFQRFDFLIIE